MVRFRKLSFWLVLASYLFANTWAASWHDHHDVAACQSAIEGHRHSGHCTGKHDTGDHDHDCDHDRHEHTPGQSPGAPHHCVVCEFLALAPLPASTPRLIVAQEAVSAEVVLPVVRLSEAPIQAHPARGPPVAG